MADDIDAHGLIQNLVAYEEEGFFVITHPRSGCFLRPG
ncbi:hypothetical protein FHY04_004482 [Sphingomonas sp. BK481]|jgi:hypothetical protein|nr:hypothetical protein [Sphingomonas sp. BK481]